MCMRKRLAICVLTAAMALTMLTACGGSNQPNVPENPGNSGTSGTSGTSQGSENNNGGNTGSNTGSNTGNNTGNTGNADNGNNTQKPDPDEENKIPASWDESRTKAYYKTRSISNTNIYINGTINVMDSDLEKTDDVQQITYAAKGKKQYISLMEGNLYNTRYQYYKNEKGEYFVNDGDGWNPCTKAGDIEMAKEILKIGETYYATPSNPDDFSVTKNKYYFESVIFRLNTGEATQHIYTYTSQGQLAGVFCRVESDPDTVFFTCPITLSACSSNSPFPNL